MKRQKNKSDKNRGTAVVVNDDPTQLKVLAGLLQKEGVDATMFESAEAALVEMNAARPPDLIVTDLYMPGIDGWRFCRLLRSPEYEAFNAVPILVVSATFAGDEASRITADLGANAFLPSPVNGRRFIHTVRALGSGEKPKESLRVLVLEDSRTIAGLLAKRFEEHGYQADVAFSLREASIGFADAAYDIAVLDYHLPDGLGDELLQKFRMKSPNCVCIMITTDPDPKLALSWMKAGAAAYLRKPFDPEYLIEQCIRARRERALVRVEDLLEDRTRHLREQERVASKAAAALKRKSEEQRLLLDTIDTQVWYLTDIETYGRLNQSHAAFLGLDAKDIAHKRLEDFVSRDVAQASKASNIEVFQKKRPLHTEEWIPNAVGEKRMIAITKTPKLNANGNVEYVVCAGTDITEQIRLQQRLQMLEKNESLERMTGAIAHLFNNHLAVVIGNLELLAEDLQPGYMGHENLKEAQTAAHRAAETSGLMLTFLGQSEGKPVPVDFVKACRQRLVELEVDRPMEAEIRCELPESGPVIRVDRFHLDQIISALVTNAWESLEKALGTFRQNF
jgi:PAS domain S-box-containing protein